MPYRYDPGELGTQEVEIAITHCGICHSDLHLISNDWGVSQLDVYKRQLHAPGAPLALAAGVRLPPKANPLAHSK